MPHRIFYASTATRPMSDEDLREILTLSRANNQRDGVRGALIYHDMSFLQVLEGPQDAVMALWERLEEDPRHHDLFVFQQKDVEEPIFREWTMAWVRAAPILDAGFDATLLRERGFDDDELQVLLETFRRSVRLD